MKDECETGQLAPLNISFMNISEHHFVSIFHHQNMPSSEIDAESERLELRRKGRVQHMAGAVFHVKV